MRGRVIHLFVINNQRREYIRVATRIYYRWEILRVSIRFVLFIFTVRIADCVGLSRPQICYVTATVFSQAIYCPNYWHQV
jgi:hypothetical protein